MAEKKLLVASFVALEAITILGFGSMSHFLKPRYCRGIFCRPTVGSPVTATLAPIFVKKVYTQPSDAASRFLSLQYCWYFSRNSSSDILSEVWTRATKRIKLSAPRKFLGKGFLSGFLCDLYFRLRVLG